MQSCYAWQAFIKQPGRPYWFCAFSIFDAATGENKRVFRSTECRDRKHAKEICDVWTRAVRLGRRGELNKRKVDELVRETVKRVCEASDKTRFGEEYARRLVARGVDEIYEKANLESLERQTSANGLRVGWRSICQDRKIHARTVSANR
jgi:hypothetical protein